MAMVKCPKCGREISDKADVCIYCGCRVERYLAEQAENEAKELAIKNGTYVDPAIRRKKILSAALTVLIVVLFIAAVSLYAILSNADDTDLNIAVAEDATEEFLNGGLQPYLDDIIEKCGLNDLMAELAVDYDSIQKLTLSVDFGVNVSFVSDEIDDYYCERYDSDERKDKLRSVMQAFSQEAANLDNETFEFTTSADDYIRLHLYTDYHTITTSDGREYYYNDTDSYEELTVDGEEILGNE